MNLFNISKLFGLLFMLASFYAHADNYDFKPGLWETKVSVEITGMPKEMSAMMQPPVLVESECVKQDDVNFMMQGEKADKNCKITNKRISAEKVQMKMICVNGDVTTKGHGEIHFKGTVVTGWFDMQMPGPMGRMTMKSVFDSKYIGPCEE